MSITRLNNNSITSVTALPSGVDTGKVLQVQSRSFNDNSSTSSTSPVASVFEHTITPTSTTSGIYIMIDGGRSSYSGGSCEGTYWLYRSVGGGAFSEVVRMKQGCVAGGSDGYAKTIAFNYLQTPIGTTSALIYKVYFRTTANTWYLNSDNSRVTVTLMEIAS